MAVGLSIKLLQGHLVLPRGILACSEDFDL